MLDFLRGRAADRKLRLFACACCRRIWPLLTDGRSRHAVAVAEGYAEGRVGEQELRAAHDASRLSSKLSRVDWGRDAALCCSSAWEPHEVATGAARFARYKVERKADETLPQAALLRDVFGPFPFRPVSLRPDVLAWGDRLVVRLARGIYDARRFADLPLLGDALLDAGCDEEEVLAHCRAGGEHVLGCWALDLILGKS
jgi:hypothetical protein